MFVGKHKRSHSVDLTNNRPTAVCRTARLYIFLHDIPHSSRARPPGHPPLPLLSTYRTYCAPRTPTLRKIVRRNTSETDIDATARAAAVSAAARVGLGEGEPQETTSEQVTARSTSSSSSPAVVGREGDRAATGVTTSDECAGSEAIPVIKSDSIFPKGTPTPVLVQLPEDSVVGEDGRGDVGAESFLLKEELLFSEVHTFSKHVRDETPFGFVCLFVFLEGTLS